MEDFLVKKHKNGFSLMELLIVIAIIGALVAIAVSSYSSAQKRSRDSRRSSDLKAIQNAWEQYYSDNSGAYPATCTISAAYLPQGMPVDPKTGSSYTGSCSASVYCFCGAVENTGKGNASDASCTFASGGNYHCVKSLQ
jgi:prepilin-type N-terminal cleavage/methylation domain-containing protein